MSPRPTRPGFALVLHSHIPLCRNAGVWPHGEGWIHEAAAECYVPLVSRLTRLVDRVPVRLTLGVTPILAEQLADPGVQSRFVDYLDARATAADQDADTGQGGELARHEAARYRHVAVQFSEGLGGDLIGAIRRLADQEALDLMGSAATHAYLPLLATDASIRGQVVSGARAHRRHFGRDPVAFWLPECGYRPSHVADGQPRAGLEVFLEAVGARVTFVETHALRGGGPVGKAAETVVGPYGPIPERELLPVSGAVPSRELTTFRPYRIGERNVAAFGRDDRTSMQIWSAQTGYPGDPAYREFHRQAPTSGLRYWRVTGQDVPLNLKEDYDPTAASDRAEAHARHFVSVVEDRATRLARIHGGEGLLVAMMDTELFGHWWHEGPEFLEAVLVRLAVSERVELTTPVAWLNRHGAAGRANVPETSWGAGGGHHTWHNEANAWMWPLIRGAELRMARLAADSAGRRGGAEVLNAAARELLFLQSSDWPFLVATGQAADYAADRFNGHLARFNRLAFLAGAGDAVDGATDPLGGTADLFPDIDYRDWAPDRASGVRS